MNKKQIDRLGSYVLFFLVFIFCGVINLIGTNTYATDSISLSINNPNLEVNMMSGSSSGTFAKSNDMNISVSTTRADGYTLYLASSTGSTDIINTTDSSKRISTLQLPISESDFFNISNTQYNNKWGYKPSTIYDSLNEQTLANTNFRPLPNENGEIIDKTSSANSTANTYTLSIGARVDNQAETGSYISDAFAIVAISNTPLKIYMQETTANQCPAETTVVYDSRDEADYTIAMLQDGGCWMTQNLRLGADGNQVTVTSADSAVTNQFQFTVSSDWNNLFTSSTINSPRGYYPNDTEKGVYYNWYTATAGIGNSSIGDGVEISSSICPKGWHLPSQSDYVSLLDSYGIDNLSYGGEALVSPLLPNYVATGTYYDTLNNATTSALNWKNKSSSDGKAGIFLVGASNYFVNNTFSYDRFRGLPVRCLLDSLNSFTVNYDANGGTGAMSSQSTNVGTLKLNANTFTRSGDYIFAGWSTDQNASVPMFMDGATIKSYSSTLTLYAVWYYPSEVTFTLSNASEITVFDKSDNTAISTISTSSDTLSLDGRSTYYVVISREKLEDVTIASGSGSLSNKTVYGFDYIPGVGPSTVNVVGATIPALQNLSSASCTTVENYAYDTRDNQVYSFGRLGDGKCHLLDNLNLGASPLKSNLTNSNTNVNTTITVSNFNNWKKDLSNSVYTTGEFMVKHGMEIDDVSKTKKGVAYNYCAASAGTYCYEELNGSGNASYDLCPAGWRLMTSGEFQGVLNTYNTTDLRRSSYSLGGGAFGYGGYFSYAYPSLVEQSGAFWTSTFSNSSGMCYYSIVGENRCFIGRRDFGYTIRCVLK